MKKYRLPQAKERIEKRLALFFTSTVIFMAYSSSLKIAQALALESHAEAFCEGGLFDHELFQLGKRADSLDADKIFFNLFIANFIMFSDEMLAQGK